MNSNLISAFFRKRKGHTSELEARNAAIQLQNDNLREQVRLRRKVKDLDRQLHLFAILLEEGETSASWEAAREELLAKRQALMFRITELERTEGEPFS